MEQSFRLIFIYCCVFSCIIPASIGIIHFRYLNKSLKIFFFWLIINLLFIATSAFLVTPQVNYYLEFINICISFLFLYLILKESWQKTNVNQIMLGLMLFIIIISIAEVFLFFDKLEARKNYSSTTQTLIWVLVSFYYLKRLLSSSKIKDIGKYSLFWIGLSNFLSSIISLFYYFITNSALRFSKDFYHIIENITFSSVLGMNILFAIGLFVSKKGIREIIKV
jgi:hypothetical protein